MSRQDAKSVIIIILFFMALCIYAFFRPPDSDYYEVGMVKIFDGSKWIEYPLYEEYPINSSQWGNAMHSRVELVLPHKKAKERITYAYCNH